MRDVVLTISAGGSTYSYRNDALSVDVGTVDVQVSDLDVELQDIPVTVQDSLAGYTDGISLPEELWRAKLEDGAGKVLLNGAIITSDIDYREKRQEFQLRVIDQAPRTVEETLKRSYFETPRTTLSTVTVDAQTTKDDGITSETIKVHRLREALVGVLDFHGWSYDLPDPLWDYTVEYDTFQTTRTSSDVVMEVAFHEHSTILQAIAQYAGFRVIPTYEAFPSSAIHIDFQKTDWPAPPPSDTLDVQAQAETTQTINEGGGQWGLKTSLGAEVFSDDTTSQDFSGELATGALPPLYAAVPHEAPWSAEPARQVYQSDGPRDLKDERNVLADLAASKVDFIGVSIQEMAIRNAFTEYEIRGPAFAPEEPDFSSVSIGELASDGTSLMWGRHPNETEFVDGIYSPAHAAHWPDAPYTQQQQRRTTWREVEGPFVEPADLQPGDRTALYDYEGREWIGWESRRDIDRRTADLRIRTPTDLTTRPARPDTPPSDWFVLTLEADLTTLDRGNGGLEEVIAAHWEPSPTQHARDVFYEVEIKNTNTKLPGRYIRYGGQQPQYILSGNPRLDKDASKGDASVTVACDSGDELYLDRGHRIYFSEEDGVNRYTVATPIHISSGETKDIQLQSGLNTTLKSQISVNTEGNVLTKGSSPGQNISGSSKIAYQPESSTLKDLYLEPGWEFYLSGDPNTTYTADGYVDIETPYDQGVIEIEGSLNRNLGAGEGIFVTTTPDKQTVLVERAVRKNRGSCQLIVGGGGETEGSSSVNIQSNAVGPIFYVEPGDPVIVGGDNYKADATREIQEKSGLTTVTVPIQTQLRQDYPEGTTVSSITEDPPFRTYATSLVLQYIPKDGIALPDSYAQNISVRVRPAYGPTPSEKGDWKTVTPTQT
jgi:hypothetical protein